MRNSPSCDGPLIALGEDQWQRFEEALVKLGVPTYKAPFFRSWIHRWAKIPFTGVGENTPQAFARSLEAQMVPEWQCRQAYQAVKIWLECSQGTLGAKRVVVCEDWSQVKMKMKRSLQSKHYSERTIESYMQWVDRFSEFCPIVPADSESASKGLQDYLVHLAVVNSLSPSSIAVARNALAWMARKEMGFELVLEEKGQSHHSKRLPRILARQTVKRILEGCEKPWDLLFGLQYGCGFRLAELLDLRVQDLDLERRVVTVRSGKGDKDRQIPLPQTLLERLESHLMERMKLWEGDVLKGWAKVEVPHALSRKFPQAETSWAWQHVFGAPRPLRHPESNELRRWHPMEKLVRETLHRVAADAGVTGRVHPHLLRHCFATHLVEGGVSLPEVQQLMGHARLETTMVYLHVRSPVHAIRSPLDLLSDP